MKIYKVLKVNLIFAIIFAFPSSVMYVYDMILEGKTYVENLFEIVQIIILFFIIMFTAFLLLFNILCLPIYIIKLFSKIKTTVNKQYVDTKESIYTRELPERYNSVIAGEILDFKSRFEEEYVAGVIELISKGYITEDEDKLIVNDEKSRDKLLKNEKYILDTCTKTDYSFVYNYEFYKKIREDMFDLELYKDNRIFKNIKEKIIHISKNEKNSNSIGLIIFITFFALVFLFICNFKLMSFIVISTYIVILIISRKNKLTPKGELEKEKISKLKLFFDRETNFENKTKEERKLWDRYSAFAVALGSNEEFKKEILKKCLIK